MEANPDKGRFWRRPREFAISADNLYRPVQLRPPSKLVVELVEANPDKGRFWRRPREFRFCTEIRPPIIDSALEHPGICTNGTI